MTRRRPTSCLSLLAALGIVCAAGMGVDRARAQSDLVFGPDGQSTFHALFLPLSEAAIAEVPIAVNLEPLGAASPTLRLSRPDGSTYRATRFGFERRGVRDYVWRGHLSSPTSPAGEVTLTVRNGLLAGLVTRANTVYEIVPRSEESALLVEVDQDRFPPCGVESAPAAATAPSEEPPDAPSLTCPQAGTTILDVLALYTPAARDLWGASFVEHRIQLAVDVTNTAFQISCVDAQLRLVHTALVDYVETGDSFAALDWVTNETNDPNGTVSQLRNDHAADLVSLFVSGGLCGVAHVMRTVSMSFESQAEQVIELGCAVSGLGYPHEVGHNLGAEHNPENGIQPPSLASYPWSYGHYVNGQFRTIMSYPDPCANGCPKVQLFSNPDLTFNGFPTGIADRRDNHRTFNLTAPLVANFRTACGNGSVGAGEQCDDGAANGTEASCCTATCQFAVAGSACAGGACDGMGHCGPTATTTSTTTSTTATQPPTSSTSTTTTTSTSATTTSTTHPLPCGDVSGDSVVNIGDALLVAQFDVGLRPCGVAPFSHPEVCDVNGDGACNIGDALRMAQCDVGLVSCAFTCAPFTCPSMTSTTLGTTTTTTTSTTTTAQPSSTGL